MLVDSGKTRTKGINVVLEPVKVLLDNVEACADVVSVKLKGIETGTVSVKILLEDVAGSVKIPEIAPKFVEAMVEIISERCEPIRLIQ